MCWFVVFLYVVVLVRLFVCCFVFYVFVCLGWSFILFGAFVFGVLLLVC